MHVSIRQLTKTFGALQALSDITLELEPGRLVALMGENGAGKTTLLRCLAGILGPTTGHVLYDGEALDRERLDIRRRFLLLPDTPQLRVERTPLEHVAMVARLYERSVVELQDRVIQWFDRTRMLAGADVPLMTLSRGQQYKAGLIALLAADPEFWMLDEPFAAGMDPAGIAVLREEISESVRRGRTVLYSTQLPEIAEGFADQIVILSRGRIIASGSLDKLRRDISLEADASLAGVFAELHGQ